MDSLALKLELDYQHFAFETGKTFRGLTISETTTGYNIVIRGRDTDGTAVYCMTTAEEPQEGLQRLLEAQGTRGGEALWRVDRFAKG